ncbi:MAG: AAA family ATPase [Gammaproteobacteria bacterium]|nr:AAA family ATPase [Gammaproteobacteria bacterium]
MPHDYNSEGALNEAANAEWDAYSSVVMQCFADIKPQPIEWVWKDRIARGKVTLVVGDPGLGKSMSAVDMTARVTRGKPWPVDGGKAPLGDVLILSAEDAPADTIRPRLDIAGADVQRVHLLKAIREKAQDGRVFQRQFSLKRDLDHLSDELSRREYVLVIIDPVSCYLDSTDSHTNADIRALLAPLAELAATYRVAVVCVTHFNKAGGMTAMYRAMGSIAFVAAARAVWTVTKARDDSTRRLVLPVKNNLSPDRLGMAFRIKPSLADPKIPILEWEPDPVTITADEALNFCLPESEKAPKRSAAEDWLRDLLKDGPLSAKEVRKQVEQSGQSWTTVRRAQGTMGIKPTKTRFDGEWEWALPQDAQGMSRRKKMSILGDDERLGEFPDKNGMSETAEYAQSTEDAHVAQCKGDEHLGRNDSSSTCFDSDDPELIEAEMRAGSRRCPRCDGEGCRWCKGEARQSC